ncbi:MAG: prepilin-type N-terminal cleavage/methylation domain-containing protein [Lachnospiraceae bacterium]|nr:prepilin-type N-terminal cleavage/methylation domain-containing protein [Lachnospiraceae bacterium]
MKKLNRKGFTMAELLIVVAIIAVLVAIAIPIFTTQLEKAREATDVANIRAAYAEAAAEAITSDAATITKQTAATTKSTGAIDKITPENLGPWSSGDITITKGQKVTVTGTKSGDDWTWSLSGGATVSTTP